MFVVPQRLSVGTAWIRPPSRTSRGSSLASSGGRILKIFSTAVAGFARRQRDCDTPNLTNAGVYPKVGDRRACLMVLQVMSPEVLRVRSDASVAKVIEMFVKQKMDRIFVTDQDAVLVGEIDLFELLRTLGECVDAMQISHDRPK